MFRLLPPRRSFFGMEGGCEYKPRPPEQPKEGVILFMTKKINSFYRSFIEFISKGNIIQLAIGLALGTAFTAVVKSVVDELFMPIVGALTAGLNFAELKLDIPSLVQGQVVSLGYGKVIAALINFLILGLCLFLFIKLFDRLFKKEEKAKEEEAPVLSGEEKLLGEILEELRKQQTSAPKN